ncbi:MAG: thiamine phosphate synthase [Arcobacter sp.]|nr:thiamine phosphate synthase [Arcobacter sp.]
MSLRLEEVLGFKPNTSNYLYALCDYGIILKKDIFLSTFVKTVKKYDTKIVQYRDKINSNDTQIENLKYLKKHLDIPIIINDRIELINYADGIHLGQEDFLKINKNKELALKIIRKKIGNKLLGMSTHNETEILEANRLDLDMIGLGAYKSTSTKDVNDILGSKISYLAKISNHPVCAIGGVNIKDKIDNITFNTVGSALYED